MMPLSARFSEYDPIFTGTLDLVAEAASLLNSQFRSEDLDIQKKPDGSPITTADKCVDALMQTRLPELFSAPVISEESPLPTGARSLSTFWLVDPLDGTQNFIAGEDEFSIVVGLVIDGVPRLGFVAAPAKKVIFAAIRGGGAWRIAGGIREALALRATLSPPLRVVTSRFPHPAALARVRQFCERTAPTPATLAQVGSAYKSMLLLEDRADLAVSFDAVSLWDLGGVACLLHEVGCTLRSTETGAEIPFDLARGTGVNGYFAYHPEALSLFSPEELGIPSG